MKQDPIIRKEIQVETTDWHHFTMEAAAKEASYMVAQTWNRYGLEMLAVEAKEYFVAKTGISLPWNLATWGPYVSRSANPYRKEREGFKENAEATFRFCGWLRKAADSRVLCRLIQRTTSVNGVNSPRTTLDLWKFAERFPSPHRAVRFIRAVRARANDILKPYGLKVSWQALAAVLQYGSRKVGKAAVQVAAATVEHYSYKFYEYDYRMHDYETEEKVRFVVGLQEEGFNNKRNCLSLLMAARGLKETAAVSRAIASWAYERVIAGEFTCLRNALEAVPGRLVEDTTDGVHLYLDTATSKSSHGITTTDGWNDEGRLITFVQTDRRSYHAETQVPSMAIKQALQAWKRQRDMERQESDLLAVLQPEDQTVLVFRQDSYAAGNCQAGTNSWLSRLGWDDRQFVPVTWLLPHLGEQRVKNVLQAVVNRLTKKAQAA